MRWALLAAMFAALPALGTTLERLSMDDLVAKSTSIVRGRVGSCAGELRTGVVYTRCQIAVAETWKGAAGAATTVLIPGGNAAGLVQTFAGAPKLQPGADYVFFLWAGKSGNHQVIGLTQGLFLLSTDGKVVERSAATEPMVDAAGQPVTDRPLRYSAAELRKLVTETLAKGARR